MKPGVITRGFTLIELLIVVAIIAILAAIAVPNFMEAQVRAKSARAKADMRTITTGLETYRLDYNKYPLMNQSNFAMAPENRGGTPPYSRTLERLTSPVSYLTGRSTFADPFPAKGTKRLSNQTVTPAANEFDTKGFSEYFYAVRGLKGNNPQAEHLQWGDVDARPQWYLLQSSGPKLIKWYFGTEVNTLLANDTPNTRAAVLEILYDATNGTISDGTVLRVGGLPTGRGSVLGKAVQEAGN